MNSILGSRTPQTRTLRRWLAVLLLFLMASDFGFHLAESFLESANNPASAFVLSRDVAPEPPGGCGIPGHHGRPFHHHHFPTLISQTLPPLPLMAVAVVSTIPALEFSHSAFITPIGRAPPVRF